MNETSFIELLGYSFESDKIKSFTKEYKINGEIRIQKNAGGYIYQADTWKEGDTISLTFIGNKMYSHNYGTPINTLDNDSDELIVSEITVDNNFVKNKEKSPIELPFSLELGDSKDLIFNKLKKKPYEKSNSSYGYSWWFRFDNFRILTALNEKYELIWLRVMKLDKYEIEKENLKKELRQQNKNIKTENIVLLSNFKSKLPTIEWTKRKLEGDDIFTNESINIIEKLLIDYINQLIKLTSKKNATTIYNSVKKITTSINKANDKLQIIDTLEREEICDFINQIVRKTGLNIDSTIDLTEDWREW
ncbi:hypothetical protein [uncultured Maribacter sp.]|uniref:hypothetical protein n=1 Tax=uncultured Maribacter sp. TaxID=431308 RepID=UPI00260A342B|nr:hypothetical protein [uncultured Maribacter sp.]